MNKTIYHFTLVLLSTFLIFSCDKEDEAIVEKSSDKSITAFSISSVLGTISESDKTINLSLPYGTDVTALAPAITVSASASVSPESGVEQDFTNPVEYEVTAEDDSKESYTVTVEVEESENNDILSFDFNGLTPAVVGELDIANNTVTLTVPRGTNLTALVPTITISDDATMSPESGVAVDFSSVVLYTVTSQSGTEAAYTVTVVLELNNENSITEFKFEGFTPELLGSIDQDAQTINVIIPWDAEFDTEYDIFSLTPTITISEGATVDPASGVSENFNFERTFTVTAENRDQKAYAVNVEEETPPTATVDALTITEYSIGEFIVINGSNFTRNECYVVLGATTTSTIISDITKTSFKIEVTSFDFSVGDINLIVKVRDQEFDLGTVTILSPPPSISSLTISTTDSNNILRIDGANFKKGENQVYFVKGTNEESSYIKSENDNSRIEVIIPAFIETGDYSIKVVTSGKEVVSTETIAVTMSTSTEPVITGVSQTTIAGGETLEIYGKNFKNVGAGVTIGWLDSFDPTKTLTGSVISSELIEVVIDRTKLSSDYVYEFYLQWPGLEYSENNFYNIQVTD